MTKPEQGFSECIQRLEPLRHLEIECCCQKPDCMLLQKTRTSYKELVEDGLYSLGKTGLQLLQNHAEDMEEMRMQNQVLKSQLADRLEAWEKKDNEANTLEEQLREVTGQLEEMGKRAERAVDLQKEVDELLIEIAVLQAKEISSDAERRIVEDRCRKAEAQVVKLNAQYDEVLQKYIAEQTKSEERLRMLGIRRGARRVLDQTTIERTNSMPSVSDTKATYDRLRKDMLAENGDWRAKYRELHDAFLESQNEVESLRRQLAYYEEFTTEKSALTTSLIGGDPLQSLGTTAPANPTVHVHNYYSIQPRKRKSVRRRPLLPQDNFTSGRVFTAPSSYSSQTTPTNPRWSATTTIAPLSPQHYKTAYHSIDDHLNGTASAPASPSTSPTLQSPISMSNAPNRLYRSNSHESILSLSLQAHIPPSTYRSPELLRNSGHIVSSSNVVANSRNLPFSSAQNGAYSRLQLLRDESFKSDTLNPDSAGAPRKAIGYVTGGLRKFPSWATGWARRGGSSTETTPGPTPGTTPNATDSIMPPRSGSTSMKRGDSNASFTSFTSSTAASSTSTKPMKISKVRLQPSMGVATTCVTSAPMNIPGSLGEEGVKPRQGVGKRLLGAFVDTGALRDSLREHEGMLG